MAWTYLLQHVEQENHIWATRKAFEAFFSRYPYCYGYWKKYADLEKQFGFNKEAREVYERGLQSIPLSVDLWVHYITFLQETLDSNTPDMGRTIHSVFELALASAGTDFRSDRLWEVYIGWERERGNWKAVTAIYDRVLAIPTQLYSQHFDKFKDHVQSLSPREALSTDEFLRLRCEVVNNIPPTHSEGEGEGEGEGDEGPPGDEAPPGVGPTNQQKADAEMERIRNHLIETRRQIHLQNEEEVSQRWNYEEGIKRPYFHVKPLERAQLKNWQDYLEFEMSHGTNERILVLFERCVIACALYEDFWIKYVQYLEKRSVEGVRNVFQRACVVHLPHKPTLHLLWAAFEEREGNVEEARRILCLLQAGVPGLSMVLLRRVGLERRAGRLDRAESLLREALESCQDVSTSSFLSIKLARQLLKVHKSLVRGRRVLLEAIERDQENARLYLNLLELEFSSDVRLNETHILSCFERALGSAMAPDIKLLFSQRRVEFLEDFGSNIKSLLDAYNEHQKLLKQNSSKKRAAENGTEEPEEKRVRGEEGAVSVVPPPVTTATTGPAPTGPGPAPAGPGDVTAFNSYSWYQPYGPYAYQSPWNYSHYYPPS